MGEKVIDQVNINLGIMLNIWLRSTVRPMDISKHYLLYTVMALKYKSSAYFIVLQ